MIYQLSILVSDSPTNDCQDLQHSSLSILQKKLQLRNISTNPSAGSICQDSKLLLATIQKSLKRPETVPISKQPKATVWFVDPLAGAARNKFLEVLFLASTSVFSGPEEKCQLGSFQRLKNQKCDRNLPDFFRRSHCSKTEKLFGCDLGPTCWCTYRRLDPGRIRYRKVARV